MKWTQYPIPASDKRAKKHILDCLEVGATGHTLPKKLHSRFTLAEGPILAIAFEGMEVDKVTGYQYAQYHFGRGILEISHSGDVCIESWPIEGLRDSLFNYLCSATQRLVIIDDWHAKRSDWWQQPEVRAEWNVESKRAFFNEEVMYYLAPVDDKCEIDDDTIRSASGRWNTGVCVDGILIPPAESWSESFLNEIVAKTEQIFVPAFDGEGFLIWTPDR
jgi:hypothetical protein